MSIIIKTDGVDYSANNVGWFGEHFPAFGGALEWAGAFGSGWEMPGGYDYSMRGRPGQVVGTPTEEAAFGIMDLENYVETPVTDSGVLSAGAAGKLTLLAVVSGLPVSGTASIISTIGTSVQSGLRFGKAAGAGTISLLADKGAETQSSVTLGAGASGAGAEFIAAVVSGLNVSLYRRGAGDASMLSSAGTLALSGVEGRDVGWRVGSVYSGSAPEIRIGMAGIYNAALTAGQIAQAYEVAKKRMALRSIAI